MRALRLVVALVGVCVLAACVRIPESGPVRSIDDDTVEAGNAVRYDPPGPSPGATPADVVYGFLDAMLAYPVSVEVASDYLTPDAADAWRPQSATTVYRAPRVSAETGDATSRATVSVDVEATLDDRSRYTPADGASRTTAWDLEQVDGEWRIATPPDGLMLEERFFEQTYRPVSLFFLTANGRRLVESPVYLPTGESLPTSLVAGLLRGPGDLLGGSARTAFPASVRLAGPVPVRRDGVAEVDLAGDPSDLDARNRELISAQLVRTLGQVPGVQGVRIDVDGAPLEVAGISRTQPLTAWTELDPPGGRTVGQVFALQDDRMVVVNGSGTDEVASAFPDGTAGVADFRVDPRLRRLAVVPAARDRVVVTDLDTQPDLTGPADYLGADVLKPVWDAEERVWVVDRVRAGTRLSVVDGESVLRVPLGALGATTVDAFELSPDNARFVALARPRGSTTPAVYVGEIATDSAGVVRGVQNVRTLSLADYGVVGVRSVAFRSPTTVVLLATLAGRSAQSVVVRVDGSMFPSGVPTGDSLLADVGARQVLASGDPDAPLYVWDVRQQLWLRDEAGRWQRVDSEALRVPSYPG